MGELSVTWNPYLRKWLILYGCDSPRGINFRVADRPWGPWSAPTLVFDPRSPTDGGYCLFIHDAVPCPAGSPNPKDDLREGGSGVFGGEYAPYLIDALTRGDVNARTTTIYFTMSTWNPYQVVLMRSTLFAK
jgi:hypothetical protein